MDPNQPGGGGWGGQQGGYPAQQQQQQGWGQQQGYPDGGAPMMGAPFLAAKNSGYIPSDEEKQQAFYAHLFGGLANVILCGSGLHLIGALIPMFMAKQKTPFLMFHVNQAFIVQLVLFGINAVLFAIGIVLSFLCIGWLVFPLNALIILAATIYPIIVGMKVKEGQWEEYPVIGAKVLNAPSPWFK